MLQASTYRTIRALSSLRSLPRVLEEQIHGLCASTRAAKLCTRELLETMPTRRWDCIEVKVQCRVHYSYNSHATSPSSNIQDSLQCYCRMHAAVLGLTHCKIVISYYLPAHTIGLWQGKWHASSLRHGTTLHHCLHIADKTTQHNQGMQCRYDHWLQSYGLLP
jgi:hypothetical protein